MATIERRFTIGRDPACDIVIVNETVSARHAELSYLANGGLLLIDCKSRNGTYRLSKDGTEVPIQQELVSASDRIRLGAVRIGVQDLLDSPRARYPSPRLGAPKAPKSPARATPPGEIERCDCGAPKTIGQPCDNCGRP